MVQQNCLFCIIQKLTRTNIFLARTFIYLVFLIMAIILHGPIGVGTLLTVCFGGLLLNYFMPFTKKALEHIFSYSSTLPNDHND